MPRIFYTSTTCRFILNPNWCCKANFLHFVSFTTVTRDCRRYSSSIGTALHTSASLLSSSPVQRIYLQELFSVLHFFQLHDTSSPRLYRLSQFIAPLSPCLHSILISSLFLLSYPSSHPHHIPSFFSAPHRSSRSSCTAFVRLVKHDYHGICGHAFHPCKTGLRCHGKGLWC